MMTIYRFRYEEFDQYHDEKVNGKYQSKDEMLWEYDNLIVGISKTKDHFVINHYSKDIDKSEYIVCDKNYTLTEYGADWFSWVLENVEEETNV
jgi:hypothetical protein